MTIPGDTERRWWVEVSGADQTRSDDLRPALLAFVAFNRGGEAKFAGSGFILAGDPKFALALTAKHVLTEGVFKTQHPWPKHSPSALFVPDSLTRPSIKPRDLKVYWGDSKNAMMMDVAHVNYNESLDVACCIVEPQVIDEGLFRPVTLPMDTTVPCVGDLVHMLSLENLTASVEGLEDGRLVQTLTRRVSLRVGVVTGIYSEGHRQCRWPCFTTSIPAEPGMSGGLVVLPEPRKTITACGLVSADYSTEDARQDSWTCGESVIACMWPALGMRLPVALRAGSTVPTQSLYEFMRSGEMPMAVGGIDAIDIIELEDGNYSIKRR